MKDKYQDALERARKIKEKIMYSHLSTESCKAVSEYIDEIIPELAESEDERIVKRLILLLQKGGYLEEPDRTEIFAWLEKQKEQKPISAEGVLVRAGLKPYKDGNQWCVLAGDNIQDGICGFGDTIEDALYEFLIEVLSLQKERKPKMIPKWLYRLEFRDGSCGLWYNGQGEWCFESGIGSVDGCKTRDLPMDYDERYKQDGRNWFSSCSRKEDLMHWYSLEDAKELISKGFVFTRYLATEYHEYEQQTVFIKETALYREEIDIFDLFKQKPAEKPINWAELTWKDIVELEGIINNVNYEFRNGIGQESFGKEVLEKFCEYKGDKYLDEVEQKPAEKPSMLEQLREYLTNTPKEQLDAEFEALKEFTIPKSAEWSEEDEKIVNNILYILGQYIDYKTVSGTGSGYATPRYGKEIDWLKSLRPQPRWKPSEEQMEALKYALGEGGSYDREALESLYNNLRKLM